MYVCIQLSMYVDRVMFVGVYIYIYIYVYIYAHAI